MTNYALKATFTGVGKVSRLNSKKNPSRENSVQKKFDINQGREDSIKKKPSKTTVREDSISKKTNPAPLSEESGNKINEKNPNQS